MVEYNMYEDVAMFIAGDLTDFYVEISVYNFLFQYSGY
jgi:hypothetical protein